MDAPDGVVILYIGYPPYAIFPLNSMVSSSNSAFAGRVKHGRAALLYLQSLVPGLPELLNAPALVLFLLYGVLVQC